MIPLSTTLKRKNPALQHSAGYIASDWTAQSDSGKTFDVVNPSAGYILATLPDMGVAETKRAIDATHAVQPIWTARTGKDHATILRRLFHLMIENCYDFVAILIAIMGKPLAEAKGKITYGASYVEWFAEEAKRIYGDVIPGHQPDKRIVVLKQPIGVVTTITPRNFPNAMVARKLAMPLLLVAPLSPNLPRSRRYRH